MPGALCRFETERLVALPRAAVWHVLSDTNHLNREVGLPGVIYQSAQSDGSGPFRVVEARIAGVALRWREYPFEWAREGRYSVVRVYERGPIARFEGGIELEDAGTSATRLRVFSAIASRRVTGRALVEIIGRHFTRQVLRFCDVHLREAALAEPSPAKPAAIDEALLTRLVRELKKRPVAPQYADELARLLRGGLNNEVAALRPFEWAQRTGLDAQEALRTCLHGVKTGLLDMQWAMMCPNCRVTKASAPSLSGLDAQVHCDLCGVNYDLNFDRYIELKFAVHPTLRRAQPRVFCASGPFHAPHVLLQTRLAPGESATVPVPDATQELRLRVLRRNQSVSVTPDAPPLTRLTFDGRWNVPQARGPFLVENASAETIFVALEKTDWDALAATAARVTAMQEFRDLFAGEVLRRGRQIAVENVTLFFSDLSNSTALYEDIGDALAYDRVGSHFDFVMHHIATQGGAVVKTMGDAVMAVFHSPADAVRAALGIQSKFRDFRHRLCDDSAIDLKIGLHHGPALAVNSNDHLDYFGRTVNVAARIAGASLGGDFVLSGTVWEFAEVRECLGEAQLSHFRAKLRGVEDVFELVRVRPC